MVAVGLPSAIRCFHSAIFSSVSAFSLPRQPPGWAAIEVWHHNRIGVTIGIGMAATKGCVHSRHWEAKEEIIVGTQEFGLTAHAR